MRLTLLLCASLTFVVKGQHLSRQSISSSGSNKSEKGITIQQTIGQPFDTRTKQSGKTVFRPGFNQPVFSAEMLSSSVKASISPNPALFEFTLEISDTLYNVELVAYDERGRDIYHENFAAFKKQVVHCPYWANGVYLIHLTDEKNNLVTAKIIKHQ